MAAAIGKYAANKVMKSQMKKYQNKDSIGDNDPYFVTITDPKHPKKTKKVKKMVPGYIPEHDAKILAKMRSRSYRLDCALFTILGQRFGWSAVLGLFPGFGDAIDALLAAQLISLCSQIDGGLPEEVRNKMIFNLVVDFGIGIVPILGDFADAWWKANTKNCRLLEKHLDEKYRPHELRGHNPNTPATAFEDFSDEEDDRRPIVRGADGTADARQPTQPAPRADGQSGGGWFSGFGGARNNNREADVERGNAAPALPSRPNGHAGQETGTTYGLRQ